MAKQGAIGSAKYLAASQVVRTALMLLSTLVVARLLSPDDYGVVAMCAPFLALVVLVQDLGLGIATIQARELTRAQSSAIFWINLGAALVLAVFIVLAAPLVGLFYGDRRAILVMAASALGVLVTGSSLQHMALLNRDMAFRAISRIEIASYVATFLATLALALALRSYWALVFGTLAGAVVQAALAWRASPFRPARRPGIAAGRAMAAVGGNLTAFNLFNFLVRNVDTLIVAKAAGAGPAGLYDRSYKLMMLPLISINAPLSRLLMPLLARERDRPDAYRRKFLLACRTVTLVVVPGILVAAATSEALLPFLLGRAWRGAGPIFFWLGLAGAIQPALNLTGALFIASGRTRVMMWTGIGSAALTLAAFAIGSGWGAPGVAAGLFVASLLRLPVLFALAGERGYVRARDLWATLAEGMAGGAIGAFVAVTLARFAPFPVALGVGLVAGYATAVMALSVSGGGRRLAAFWIGVAARSRAKR